MGGQGRVRQGAAWVGPGLPAGAMRRVPWILDRCCIALSTRSAAAAPLAQDHYCIALGAKGSAPWLQGFTFPAYAATPIPAYGQQQPLRPA